jgi:hypothetical protein
MSSDSELERRRYGDEYQVGKFQSLESMATTGTGRVFNLFKFKVASGYDETVTGETEPPSSTNLNPQ